ncbi:ferredoxin [Rubritalea sp.]|uniref:ferredoxin n=1 Tax=Rubritalea sp. TaxID=2109375 RepID=UPI003EF45070
MNFSHRYPLNVPGKFYINDQCTDCDLCRECAPHNITRDDRYGQSYVYKQPTTKQEYDAVMEGVQGCPTNGVLDDGDSHDWHSAPIIDWCVLLSRYSYEAHFNLPNPIIPYDETLREEKAYERQLAKANKDRKKST